MTSAALHLASLALVGLWIRTRPPVRARSLFLTWALGVLCARLLSGMSGLFLEKLSGGAPGRVLAYVPGLIEWCGAVIVLYSLWGLVHIRLVPRRLERIRMAGLFIALLVPVAFPESGPIVAFLAVPMLWSFRWRQDLSARALFAVSVGALFSLLICAVRFSTGVGGWQADLPGMNAFAREAGLLALIYSLFALPAAASRVHLSIRRIGPRLISSHLLAALIPFILGSAFLLISGAFFLSTYRGSVAVRLLLAESERARLRLGECVENSRPLPLEPFGQGPRRQLVLTKRGGEPAQLASAAPDVSRLRFPLDSLLSRTESSAEVPLIWDDRTLYLRARYQGTASLSGEIAEPLQIEALAEVDSTWMARIGSALGTPVQLMPTVRVGRQRSGIAFDSDISIRTDSEDDSGNDSGDDGGSDSTDSDIRIATEPARSPASRNEDSQKDTTRSEPGRLGSIDLGGLKIPGGATMQCLRWNGDAWTLKTIPVASSAALAENLTSLWAVSRVNPLAMAVIIALGAIAVFLLGTIGLAAGMVLDMGRSVTKAVTALTAGTRALREGDLRYRIPVQGKDELWSVAGSFNEMAVGLERTREMELESQRMEEELRLARGIQDRLLPSGPPMLDRIELAGMSLPAREVGGDYFDYLPLEDGRLGLAVADVSGKGTPAALLMSAFRASLRSQDLAALGPAEVLARINRFIHASVDPGKFITAFLGLFDPATGEIRYANAGHDPPVVLHSDGTTMELGGGGLILGMLPQIAYEEAAAILPAQSLVAVFTDGVTEAQSEGGEFFGQNRLIEVLRTQRGRPCAHILQAIVTAIEEFAGNGPRSDDITVILARRR